MACKSCRRIGLFGLPVQRQKSIHQLIIDGENKMVEMSTSKNTDGRMKIQITKPGSSEALLNYHRTWLMAQVAKMDNQLNILLRENEFEGKGEIVALHQH
ncbi:MAG: hypothetical protein IPN46_14835 [Saprospiraceae bacterium]|nr:hypothetical protein [Saprospiraceae bacterium]